MLLPTTVLATPYCISYSYKPVISATVFRYCYQVTLSHTPISYSNQLFLSGTFISYLYLLYSYTPARYSYQNSFVTYHYQLEYHIIFRSSRLQKLFKIGVLKNFAILSGKHLRWCLFLTKLHAMRPAILLKSESIIDVLMFSSEYCEIFKNRSFYRAPLVAASNSF